MSFTPVARRSVPDAVFEQLSTEILTGELLPGAELPAERRLAEALGVSRPAVREALQRLAQAGLIEVRQGGATTVRDFRRAAGPELLPRLLMRDDEFDVTVARAIIETSFSLAPDVARRCALRRDTSVLSRLETHVDELQDATPTDRATIAFALWSTVVDGGANVVERLLFNALESTFVPTMEALAAVVRIELGDVESYRALVDAIAAKDAARAGAVARRVASAGLQAASAALEELTTG